MTVSRAILAAAALMGLSGVILAAVGSHAVPGIGEFGIFRSWQSANNMHLLHALVLLFLSSRFGLGSDSLLTVTAFIFIAGIILFSGSIYLSILVPVKGITVVAPVGGVLLMLGWVLVMVFAMRKEAA